MVLKKGILIVFEGIDGAGKSTQAKLLQKRLRAKGLDTVYFKEPSRSKWGLEIKRKALEPDSLSSEEELDLFLRDRKENVEKNLKPALEKRRIVLLDRYYFSTIAYQGARGIDTERIRKLNERFAVKPDLVFILDVDAPKGLARIQDRKKKDRLFEREDYLRKVRHIFNSFKGRRFVKINGLADKSVIHEEIAVRVSKYIKKFLQ